MKVKYFITSSGEEIKFGDTLDLTFEKETPEGIQRGYIRGEFCPAILPILLEEDIVEEIEQDKEETLDFPNAEQLLTDILARVEALEKTVKNLQDKIKLTTCTNTKSKSKKA